MATDRRPGGVSPGALRAIKAAVILMGVLIVGGMAVIVVTLINRATSTGTSEPQTTVPQSVTAALDLAPGDRIESAVLDGDRALFVIGRADGGQDVLVVDIRAGDTVLTLEGTPAAGDGPPAGGEQ